MSRVITTKIPNEIPCNQIIQFIKQLIQSGTKSIEVDVYSFGKNRLVICTNIEVYESFESEEELIYLNDLFAFIRELNSPIEIILNLKESFLENRVKILVDKWELKKQVIYCGKLNPTYLTPWDRPYIHYNIENCLPNVYQFECLKRSHFDVIYYFCEKFRVKTIRLHYSVYTEEMLTWADTLDLKLSVFGIDRLEKAEQIKKAGVAQVATSDSSVLREIILSNEYVP